MDGLIQHSETINKLLARYGVKFGIYKNGEFKEQLFPFDPIPRVISREEFSYLEKGLKQRVDALNCFLRDIYGKKQILKDGIIPEEFVFSAKGYLPPCDGVVPPKGIYSHISGIDLVQSKDDNWYILEDNLRVPSGASYPMIAREFQRKSAPAAFLHNSVIDNRNYAQMLKAVIGTETMAYIQLAIDDMKTARRVETYLADLMLVIDHILAFWGCVNDLIDDEQTRNIIKLGKGIERLDLYLSLDRPLADIRREYGRMKQFLRKSLMHHDESVLYTIDSMLFVDEVSYGIVRNLLRNLIHE